MIEELFLFYTTNFDDIDEMVLTFYTNPLFCNLNCYMCHNKHGYMTGVLSATQTPSYLSFEEILDVISMSVVQLGIKYVGVCGGEPLHPTTFQKVQQFLLFVKNNWNVKLVVETNGTYPEAVKQLSPLVDTWKIDIKLPFYFEDGRLMKHDIASSLRYFKIVTSKQKLESEHELTSLPQLIETMYSRKVSYTLSQFLDLPVFQKEKSLVLRTVRYPLLLEDEVKFISNQASKHGFTWKLNNFFQPL